VTRLRFIDLSVPIQESVAGELRGDLAAMLAAQITYEDHDASAGTVAGVFGCTPEDLPEGKGWASENVTLSTHSGTHMDAPWHYWPTTGGQPAKTIDEIPLDACFGPGVVLDLTGHEPGDRVGIDEVRAAAERTGAPLAEGEIVLLRYDYDRSFGTSAYWTRYPGLSAEATRWTVEQGSRVIGTDAVGSDHDFDSSKEEFAPGDRSRLWESHRVGTDLEYYQIEKLTRLAQLPSRGFIVACFPTKLARASAGWVRPVAIFGL
jgi:kynurenine formamidase